MEYVVKLKIVQSKKIPKLLLENCTQLQVGETMYGLVHGAL